MITGSAATLASDGGWSLDLSEPVLARALCHIDNAYWIPNIEVHGRIAKTNKTSQTAFRGLRRSAGHDRDRGHPRPLRPAAGPRRRPSCAAATSTSPGQTTPYGQPVRHAERLGDIWDRSSSGATTERRVAEVDAFNASHADSKRGLAITPVKFGISFNLTAFNQAGALVHVYKDGSVLINHGGTEMGQGLHTKMIQVAATALGVPLSYVRLAPTRTDKVPNTSATAASSGADLNGGAIKNACEQIRERLAEVAGADAGHPSGRRPVRTTAWSPASASTIARSPSRSWCARPTSSGSRCGRPASTAPRACTGTPTGCRASRSSTSPTGPPLSEVEVDGFTGAYRFLRTDIVHDVGDSLSPLIDLGQIEGGFVQGAGWLTLEELRWDTTDGPHRGRLSTQAASTYKLPSFSEMPEEFNVHLFERGHRDGRGVRVEGGRRAAADAGLQRPRGAAPGVRRLRARRRGGRPGQPGHPRGGLLGDRGRARRAPGTGAREAAASQVYAPARRPARPPRTTRSPSYAQA